MGVNCRTNYYYSEHFRYSVRVAHVHRTNISIIGGVAKEGRTNIGPSGFLNGQNLLLELSRRLLAL